MLRRKLCHAMRRLKAGKNRVKAQVPHAHAWRIERSAQARRAELQQLPSQGALAGSWQAAEQYQRTARRRRQRRLRGSRQTGSGR